MLSKMQKSALMDEVKSLDTLTVNVPFPIIKFFVVETRYGSTIQALLQNNNGNDGEGDNIAFRVYLPTRVAKELTMEEVEKYNNKQTPSMCLIFKGKLGKAFDVDFIELTDTM